VLAAALGFSGCASVAPSRAPASPAPLPPIDRQALVTRHNPVLHQFDVNSPLSVGNGEFCFTVDATGLQTFPLAYNATVPLCTMADWGWHSFPNPKGWTIDDFVFKKYRSHGRSVPYADVAGRAKGNSTVDQRTIGANTGSAESNFLRDNPHKFNLGQLGFVLTKADGTPAKPADISAITQTLDLWNGTLHSHFVFDGQPVDVTTACAPASDTLAVHVSSPLLANAHLQLQLRFPYASAGKNGSDWTKPAAHSTKMYSVIDVLTSGTSTGPLDLPLEVVDIQRRVDDTQYALRLGCTRDTVIKQTAQHQIAIRPPAGGQSFDCEVNFSPSPTATTALSSFSSASTAVQSHWQTFWSTGGAIDLSLSKDPRWFELERRIVLSQYLTAIQSTGQYPPAETGLTINSWNGKFHMEMYWWHSAHFALWDRPGLLENSLGYYAAILPRAQDTAQRQGYAGARWPKMTSPSGDESPSTVGPFLIWEQPHPIYLAELDYRAHPDQATLEKYREVVFQTATFMASYAWWDAQAGRYVLGPPLQAAQERYDKEKLFNPTFELVYWRWALGVAQQWRARLGLAPDAQWQKVIDHLSPLPERDGKYLFAESVPDAFIQHFTYTGHPPVAHLVPSRWLTDHPSVVNAYGMLPGPTVDPAVMRATFDWIWIHWDWPDTWGWDYPALAMCAARIGEPERAIESLLLDTRKNNYVASGHVYQRSPDLPLYLPGNGGLLTAVAMMAAGWDGAPARPAPGFPDNGLWTVRWEKLKPLP
jgi:hypothetical protein